MGATIIVCMALSALALVRNHMAFLWRIRALNEAHELNSADIDAGTYVDGQWRYDQIPSHEALMFDLTRWRYRSPFCTPSQGTTP